MKCNCQSLKDVLVLISAESFKAAAITLSADIRRMRRMQDEKAGTEAGLSSF